jgi:hypothetical protein
MKQMMEVVEVWSDGADGTSVDGMSTRVHEMNGRVGEVLRKVNEILDLVKRNLTF